MKKKITDKNGLALDLGDIVEYHKRHFIIKYIIYESGCLIFNDCIFKSNPINSKNVTLISRNKFMSKK